jgi:transcriptional regulator with PAS, ATPase and Fis domain
VLMNAGAEALTKDEVARALPPSGEVGHTDDQARLPLEDIERLHIARVLKASGGNKTQAAKVLGIDYKTLLNKVKEYGLGS